MNHNGLTHVAVSSSLFIMVRSRIGFWNCHSVRRCIESSLTSMGRSSQSLDSSLGGDSYLIGCTGSSVVSLIEAAASEWSSVASSLTPSAFDSIASPSPFASSGAGVGCVVEIIGVPPSAPRVSSSAATSVSSGAGEDSGGGVLTGSGPSGLASGSLFKYCLRKAVCQFSRLGYARQ